MSVLNHRLLLTLLHTPHSTHSPHEVLVPSVSVNAQHCFNSGFHLPSPQANNASGSKFFRRVRRIAKSDY